MSENHQGHGTKYPDAAGHVSLPDSTDTQGAGARTLGPWFAKPNEWDDPQKSEDWLVGPAEGETAVARCQGPNARDHARLIAAAPEMLAALKLVSGLDIHPIVLAAVDAAVRKAIKGAS